MVQIALIFYAKTSAFEIHREEHFLIARTAAKITTQARLMTSLRTPRDV